HCHGAVSWPRLAPAGISILPSDSRETRRAARRIQPHLSAPSVLWAVDLCSSRLSVGLDTLESVSAGRIACPTSNLPPALPPSPPGSAAPHSLSTANRSRLRRSRSTPDETARLPLAARGAAAP